LADKAKLAVRRGRKATGLAKAGDSRVAWKWGNSAFLSAHIEIRINMGHRKHFPKFAGKLSLADGCLGLRKYFLN
jgi:hypothetical protein